MAIGLSRLFNIKLPLNFDSPYRASSMIDFWRRWHITLSRFLRDYLYVPLGGNKKGQTRRYLNLMITMILGGLWHGANWTFVLWGALHGGYLLLNHFWRAVLGQRGGSTARASSRALFRFLSVGLTFTAVVVAWVPFRSESLEATLNIWRGMFGLNGLSLPAALAPFLPEILRDSASFAGFMPELRASTTSILLWMTTGLVIVWCLPNTQQWLALYAPAWDAVAVYSRRLTWKPSVAYGFALGIIFAISVMLFKKNSPFLYYQF
jgi:D-alanyl-lipoteichoic acid acyltransferase DltB (MBOAT superfamily)